MFVLAWRAHEKVPSLFQQLIKESHLIGGFGAVMGRVPLIRLVRCLLEKKNISLGV